VKTALKNLRVIVLRMVMSETSIIDQFISTK